jgi:hypothetical protein
LRLGSLGMEKRLELDECRGRSPLNNPNQGELNGPDVGPTVLTAYSRSWATAAVGSMAVKN